MEQGSSDSIIQEASTDTVSGPMDIITQRQLPQRLWLFPPHPQSPTNVLEHVQSKSQHVHAIAHRPHPSQCLPLLLSCCSFSQLPSLQGTRTVTHFLLACHHYTDVCQALRCCTKLSNLQLLHLLSIKSKHTYATLSYVQHTKHFPVQINTIGSPPP